MRRDCYGPEVSLRPDPSSEIEQLRRQVQGLEDALRLQRLLLDRYRVELAKVRLRGSGMAQVIV